MHIYAFKIRRIETHWVLVVGPHGNCNVLEKLEINLHFKVLKSVAVMRSEKIRALSYLGSL